MTLFILLIRILHVCIGLSGKFVPILKENWNAEDLHFSIHLLNYIGAILFYLSSSSDNLKIPSFQNLSSFSAKNFSKWFFTSTKELKLFPLREFCNDRNRWKSEGARSGEYDGWGRTSQPSSNNFCRVLSKTHYPDETQRSSNSLFLDVFVQLLFSIRLIGNNTSLNLSSRCW